MIGGEQVIFFNETKEERYENICVGKFCTTSP